MQVKTVNRKSTTYVYTDFDDVVVVSAQHWSGNPNRLVAMAPNQRIRIGRLVNGEYSALVIGGNRSARAKGHDKMFVGALDKVLSVKEFYEMYAN